MQLIAFLFFMLISLSGLSQSKKPFAEGILLDAVYKKPVAGAVIQNLTTQESTVSDENGRFAMFTREQADSIHISAIGYRDQLLITAELKTPIQLHPQFLNLKEIVIQSQINNTARLISKVDIKLRGINNSQEVLRIVPGLFIGQHAGGGKAEQIFLRGFDIDHGTDINLTVDGLPVNMVSHAHGQGYADLHFVIPELIEKIEFKKGPYEVTTGNFATAGSVTLRTKNLLPSNLVKLEAGMFNTLRGLLLLNLLKQESTSSWYIGSEYMYTKGYFDAPQDFNRLNVFSKLHTPINNRNTLAVIASAFRSRWKASGQIPEREVQKGTISYFGAIDPTEGGSTSRYNISFELQSQLTPFTSFKNQVYYSRYNFDLFSNFTFFLQDSINGDQIRQFEERDLIGYNGTLTSASYLGSIKFTTEAGIVVRYDRTKDSELSATKNRLELLNRIQYGDIRELNTALYFSESIQLNKNFSLNAGLRWDYLRGSYKDYLQNSETKSFNGNVFSPKLNLRYNSGPKTEIYISAGKGFHSNDTRVVLAGKGRESLPGALGIDLGINIKPVSSLFINAALWQLSLDQEFVFVGDAGIVEPGGKTLRRGFDFSLRYQVLPKLFVDGDLNYAFASAISEPKGQDRIPLSPTWTSSGGITYKKGDGWNSNLRYRYMGDRPANEDGSLIAEGYFVTDASVGYAKKKYEFNVTIQNLFNAKWKETQFETESRLKSEPSPVTEIHFTPGTPFFLKASITYNF